MTKYDNIPGFPGYYISKRGGLWSYFLEKLIADEEHHIKLLKEAMGMDKSTKGVTVIIK